MRRSSKSSSPSSKANQYPELTTNKVYLKQEMAVKEVWECLKAKDLILREGSCELFIRTFLNPLEQVSLQSALTTNE